MCLSVLSPTTPNTFNEERSDFFTIFASGSSLLIALIAVGDEYKISTLYFYTILKYAETSGVFIGFPSYIILVPPNSKGPYTIYEWPTTHPKSDVAKIVDFEVNPNPISNDNIKPAQVPPWSLYIPFGFPVVPDVYNIYKGWFDGNFTDF